MIFVKIDQKPIVFSMFFVKIDENRCTVVQNRVSSENRRKSLYYRSKSALPPARPPVRLTGASQTYIHKLPINR